MIQKAVSSGRARPATFSLPRISFSLLFSPFLCSLSLFHTHNTHTYTHRRHKPSRTHLCKMPIRGLVLIANEPQHLWESQSRHLLRIRVAVRNTARSWSRAKNEAAAHVQRRSRRGRRVAGGGWRGDGGEGEETHRSNGVECIQRRRRAVSAANGQTRSGQCQERKRVRFSFGATAAVTNERTEEI